MSKSLEKKRQENKSKKLLLLGTATSVFEPDYESYDEIWGVGSAFGEAHSDIKKITLGFEIHPLDQILKIANERNVKYDKFNCPIFVQNAGHSIAKTLMKRPKTFPLDDILKYIDDMGAAKFFTSSFCYMVVYAAYMGYKEVDIYKTLLTNDSEYFLERPGVEYWFEWLGMSEGIKFNFPEDAEMCSDTILYGYEQRPGLWKLESRKKFLWECLAKHYYQIERTLTNLYRAQGLCEMYQIMKQKPDKVDEIYKVCQSEVQRVSPELKNQRDKYFQFCGALQTAQYTDERGY